MSPEQAVFLVGGRGTRLGALTDAVPKPLLEVGGRPFLDILIERAAARGAREVLLLCGYLADQFRDRYHGRVIGGARVACVAEPAPLGTGGALVAARDHLHPSFVLANGDSLFDCDAGALAELPAGPGCLGRIALRPLADTGRSGVVELEGTRITRFAQRGEAGRPGLINGGVYVLERRIVERVGALPCSLEADIFPALAAEGCLHGMVFDGFFIDIGVPEDLARAQTLVPVFHSAGQAQEASP
ncbi:nucleotidyltransferase family protein [Magnetospirillum sp. UT-4]|uniref:nucleotidyltransferase family protein n=1 Tax=Magnetospirillum sp. UT-4 TaxID=2681467 RepID=UPI0013804DD6